MYIDDPLKLQYKLLEMNYELYQSGKISEKEYLSIIRPIDKEIARLEMDFIRCNPIFQKAFSKHSHLPESATESENRSKS